MINPLPAPQRRRCGMTLMEMLVVISIAGVILGISAVLLGTLLRGEANLRQSRQQQQTLTRLDLRLRTDAHAASEATLLDASTCQFSFPHNQRLVYQVLPERITRILYEGETRLHFDDFPLPSLTSGTWKVEAIGQQAIVSLACLYEPGTVLATQEISAAVGLLPASAAPKGEQP